MSKEKKSVGRPSIGIKRCIFTLTPESERKLCVLAKDKTMKKSEVIRRLIHQEYLKR